MSGAITTPEQTITNVFDLSEGPYWTAGAIDIPNPSGGVPGMSGLIRFTGAPLSWGSNFKFPEGVQINPGPQSIVPFYVESETEICLGFPTGGIV